MQIPKQEETERAVGIALAKLSSSFLIARLPYLGTNSSLWQQEGLSDASACSIKERGYIFLCARFSKFERIGLNKQRNAIRQVSEFRIFNHKCVGFKPATMSAVAQSAGFAVFDGP